MLVLKCEYEFGYKSQFGRISPFWHVEHFAHTGHIGQYLNKVNLGFKVILGLFIFGVLFIWCTTLDCLIQIIVHKVNYIETPDPGGQVAVTVTSWWLFKVWP